MTALQNNRKMLSSMVHNQTRGVHYCSGWGTANNPTGGHSWSQNKGCSQK